MLQVCRRPLIILIYLFLLTKANLLAATTSDVLGQAQAAIKNHQWSNAVSLLLPLETQLAGDITYDYMLGVALIGNQQSNIAVQVLQRVIDLQPEFADARFSLAVASYQVGDFERAYYHFNLLQNINPPKEISKAIEAYMIAINTKRQKYRPSLQTYVEASFGYDSNANAATDDEFFLGFRLNNRNVKTPSYFSSLTAGLFYTNPISIDWFVSVYGNISTKINYSAHFVDMNRGNLTARLARNLSFGQVYTSFTSHYLTLDHHYNTKFNQLDLGLDYNLNDQWQLNTNTYYRIKRYPDSLSVRSTNDFSFSGGTTHYLENGFDQVSINLGFASEKAQESLSPYSNEQTFLNIHSRFAINSQWYWQFQANLKNKQFKNNRPFFGKKRKDDQYSLSTSLHWIYPEAQNWQLSAQIDVNEQDSNILIFDFDKWQLGFNIRKVMD